jgi:hypothetical protein
LSQELEPVVDLGPVQWVRDALPEFGLFLPPDYDAYVAILHPFRRAVRSPGTLSGFAIVWLSWHEVSASLGRVWLSARGRTRRCATRRALAAAYVAHAHARHLLVRSVGRPD